ncbi:MAG TPA: D-glycerate dehydrogenase [Nitrososphaeraceae archaeon]|nr:D-glycerate dehydrogenase [Nitrososphaeraceae archaeon]
MDNPKKHSVYITRKIPEPGPSILKKYFQVNMNPEVSVLDREVLIKSVKNVDAILCMLGDRIDSNVMDAAGSNLRIISCYSVGYDHVDIKQAEKRNITVTNTPNVLANTTADLTFSLILSAARNIVNGDSLVRNGKWKFGWTPDLFLGYDVYGSTLGIIGLGEIGMLVAKRAKGFGMKVLYYSNNRNRKIESELSISYVPLEELLQQSDFVSLHVSLNKSSFHMIDESKFKLMKNTAFLINTSRGKVINEQHLIEAIKNKKIAGAGLDVYEDEPISTSNPLINLPQTVLLPHIGSATFRTRSKMAEVSANNIVNSLIGKGTVYTIRTR